MTTKSTSRLLHKAAVITHYLSGRNCGAESPSSAHFHSSLVCRTRRCALIPLTLCSGVQWKNSTTVAWVWHIFSFLDGEKGMGHHYYCLNHSIFIPFFQIEKLITSPSPYRLPCGRLMEIFLYANDIDLWKLFPDQLFFLFTHQAGVPLCHQKTRFLPQNSWTPCHSVYSDSHPASPLPVLWNSTHTAKPVSNNFF